MFLSILLSHCYSMASGLAETAPQNKEDLIITSPYADHLLNLESLDTPNQLLAKALTILQPIRPDYARVPSYTETFNWEQVFTLLRQLSHEGSTWKRRHFYVVVFPSILSPDADSQRLHELDKQSHREATVSGGLLKYWFGVKDEARRNLATCMIYSPPQWIPLFFFFFFLAFG